MLLLTFGIAILDDHTRFTHLEADTPLSAALGTAGVGADVVHPPPTADKILSPSGIM